MAVDAGARVVVLRALGVGDLCAGTPALRGVVRAFPAHHVVLAAPAPLAPLLPLVHPRIEHHPHPGLEPLPPELQRARMAVNLHGRGPQSTAILEAGRPSELVAFGLPRSGAVVEWRDEEHERDRWCRLLSSHGIDADPSDLHLLPPRPWSGARRGVTVLHPGAAAPARRWPLRRWVHLATALRRRGHDIVVTGAACDRDRARRLVDAAGLGPRALLAGSTDLGRLAAVVAAAGLVVSGDTGIAHLAFAYRRPSVTLYGPIAPSRWGPPATGWHEALWAGRQGDPHGSRVDPGLLRIEVDDVLAACARVTARADHPAPT